MQQAFGRLPGYSVSAMNPLPWFAHRRDVRQGRDEHRRRPSAAVLVAAITVGLASVLAVAGWSTSRPAEVSPDGGAGGSGSARAISTASRTSFSGIILPDLLIVLPTGLTRSEVARLRTIKGVRKMITFDGAQITVDGAPASVVGVNPDQFRSWVPLRTASDQPLWTRLAAGDFIAASGSVTSLRLSATRKYDLTGASSLEVPFGGSALLDIAGVDLVVDQAVSRRLGLVHQVAALISAPGRTVSGLAGSVRRVLGSAVKVVSLRDEGTPAAPSVPPSHITNYLQLFQASSAKYCPALSWTVLAAIGQIESGDGSDVGPSSAGALGPMQFLPSTWSQWGIDGFGPAGPPDVMDPFDAVPAAARMLCADGASSGTQAGLSQAIFDYNHAQWYVNEVLALAAQYAAEYH
jgi:Transglycosylase SLT domain